MASSDCTHVLWLRTRPLLVHTFSECTYVQWLHTRPLIVNTFSDCIQVYECLHVIWLYTRPLIDCTNVILLYTRHTYVLWLYTQRTCSDCKHMIWLQGLPAAWSPWFDVAHFLLSALAVRKEVGKPFSRYRRWNVFPFPALRIPPTPPPD